MDISTIRNRIKMIEELEAENKISKELLKSALDNDEDYVTAAKQARESLSKRKRIKDKIYGEAENAKVVEDIKANKEEMNTLQEILSTELTDYYSKQKTDEIEDAHGRRRKFKLVARLMPSDYSEN